MNSQNSFFFVPFTCGQTKAQTQTDTHGDPDFVRGAGASQTFFLRVLGVAAHSVPLRPFPFLRRSVLTHRQEQFFLGFGSPFPEAPEHGHLAAPRRVCPWLLQSQYRVLFARVVRTWERDIILRVSLADCSVHVSLQEYMS